MLKKTLKSKRGGKVYVAFIDYKKALDTVDHEKSWETLQKLKTSAKMVNVLKFMHLSMHVYNGMLEILSSLNVLLGWNRTAYLARWKNLPILLLFADDVVLVSSTQPGLQSQMSNLQKASEFWGLTVTVNLDETKIMNLPKGGHIASGEKWFHNGCKLEIVNSYKYLGYTLTTKLSTNSSREEYASKAKGKLLDPKKTKRSLWSLDTNECFPNLLMLRLSGCC